MRNFLPIVFAVFFALTTLAGYHPYRDGAEASVELSILDDSDNVVADAAITVMFEISDTRNHVIKGVSDKQGRFSASNKTIGAVSVWVSKEGYYTTRQKVDFKTIPYEEVKNTKAWSTGVVERVVRLRKIISPISLLESGKNKKQPRPIPATNEVVGLDLKLGDWCPPYGKGEYDDLQLKCDLWRSQTNWFVSYSRLEITMTNSVDGFYLVAPKNYSEFTREHNANTNCEYRREILLEYDRRNGGKPKSSNPLKDNYMIFRTRTKTDDKGNLISAQYGFIKEGLSFAENFVYQSELNPNENDTNLEDDWAWKRIERMHFYERNVKPNNGIKW